jgi:hypothetical protein
MNCPYFRHARPLNSGMPSQAYYSTLFLHVNNPHLYRQKLLYHLQKCRDRALALSIGRTNLKVCPYIFTSLMRLLPKWF